MSRNINTYFRKESSADDTATFTQNKKILVVSEFYKKSNPQLVVFVSPSPEVISDHGRLANYGLGVGMSNEVIASPFTGTVPTDNISFKDGNLEEQLRMPNNKYVIASLDEIEKENAEFVDIIKEYQAYGEKLEYFI